MKGKIMNISQIDFGPLDARHAATHGKFDESLFQKVFIDPAGVDLDDFKNGRKSFVYGIKGSGKSAILKHLDIGLRKVAETRFVYFSDIARENENRLNDIEVPIAEIAKSENNDDYWRAFIFILIARVLFETDKSHNKKFLDFVRAQTSGAPGSFWEKLLNGAPTIKSWSANIGQTPEVRIEGSFDKIVNLEHFYSSAIHYLAESKPRKKVYILVDELEVTFTDQKQFERDVRLAASLVRIVRDINESLRKNEVGVYICCAIRREVADRILGGDTAKIVRDLGVEVSWNRSTWEHDDRSFVHPLFEIVLRRIYFSIQQNHIIFGDREKEWVLKKYFPFYQSGSPGKKGTQAEILDLTTYRPRDISILFNAAKRFDGGRASFRRETFVRLIRKSLRDDLWKDFSEALRAEFTENQIALLSKVLNRLPSRFQFSDFLGRLEDFSFDPALTAKIDEYSPEKWAEVLKQLYVLGAIGNVEQGEKIDDRFKFYFRGYTDGLIIARNVDIVKQQAMIEA